MLTPLLLVVVWDAHAAGCSVSEGLDVAGVTLQAMKALSFRFRFVYPSQSHHAVTISRLPHAYMMNARDVKFHDVRIWSSIKRT